MAWLAVVRSPPLTFLQALVSLLLSTVALLSPYWCEGRQKVPKPLCSRTKHTNCIPVPGVSDPASIQMSWETGDDRFVFPSFHSGLWISCEENIHTDEWEEKCRYFMDLTPGSEKGIWWLCVTMEFAYVALLCISCLLLSVQLGLRRWLRRRQQWGMLLNAFSAVFSVLGGLLGMVAHIMFMQVFQVTASMGPEDFNPHSYGYSWAFYVAWAAFSVCMTSGVSALNSYTRDTLLRRLKHRTWAYPLHLRPAPFYDPSPPPVPPPPLSPLSPYYSPESPLHSSPSLPLPCSLSPYYSLSVPSPSPPQPRPAHGYIPQSREED